MLVFNMQGERSLIFSFNTKYIAGENSMSGYLKHAAVTASVVMALAGGLAAEAQAGAVITNGTITLGVNDEGHLNTPFSPDPLGIGLMGLRYNPTGAASTEPGCACEGWGISNGTATSNANVSVGGVSGMSLVSFTSTASTAISVVNAAGVFRVTHDYKPSVSANLYQVDVTIENTSAAAQQVLYRRVMDWDIYPTPFSEFVTIINSSPIVFRTDTNGFNAGDPLSFGSFAVGPSASNGYTPVVDAGPSDHGALFDFDFGLLAAGGLINFTTFYGAAGTETGVLAALAAVGAENVYSLGQPNTANGPTLGEPNTFVFGFKGVGGTPVGKVPEPATLALFGAGLLGVAAMRRRKLL